MEVAPFTGAWIEIILLVPAGTQLSYVAPFTGAWIEMKNPAVEIIELKSVAPFTGAWIEICTDEERWYSGSKSHLSQVRGLKS